MDPARIAGAFGIIPGMRIADFGAGNGYFTIAMAELTGESGAVNAVDVLQTSLDTIRLKAKSLGFNNIHAIRANLEIVGKSGLGDNSQDLVLMKNILFQIQDKGGALTEAVRVLRENGKLVVIDWRKGAGGFGPPDQLRVEQGLVQDLILKSGFRLEKSIDIDPFHYGYIFRKIIKGTNHF